MDEPQSWIIGDKNEIGLFAASKNRCHVFHQGTSHLLSGSKSGDRANASHGSSACHSRFRYLLLDRYRSLLGGRDDTKSSVESPRFFVGLCKFTNQAQFTIVSSLLSGYPSPRLAYAAESRRQSLSAALQIVVALGGIFAHKRFV